MKFTNWQPLLVARKHTVLSGEKTEKYVFIRVNTGKWIFMNHSDVMFQSSQSEKTIIVNLIIGRICIFNKPDPKGEKTPIPDITDYARYDILPQVTYWIFNTSIGTSNCKSIISITCKLYWCFKNRTVLVMPQCSLAFKFWIV